MATMDLAVKFLTGAFPFAAEFQNVGMAIQGAMNVRKGPNQKGTLHWFHAFMLSVVAGFGGGIFNFIWMGKPSGIIANDMAMGSCIVAFVLVNALPFRVGFTMFNLFPVELVITSSAQLFRSLGIVKFTQVAFDTFKETPSAYYPVPVLGPIIYGTLLGNMGAFVMKGFESHVGNGMPWPVQNGIFCSAFYLFYALDTEGPIGELLRKSLPVAKVLDVDDATFACIFVSLFMQIMGILQMPQLLGPSFTPFGADLLSPFMDSSTWNVGKTPTAYSQQQQQKKKERESMVVVSPEQKSRSLAPLPVNGEEASAALDATTTATTAAKKKKRNRKKKTGATATDTTAATKEKEL